MADDADCAADMAERERAALIARARRLFGQGQPAPAPAPAPAGADEG